MTQDRCLILSFLTTLLSLCTAACPELPTVCTDELVNIEVGPLKLKYALSTQKRSQNDAVETCSKCGNSSVFGFSAVTWPVFPKDGFGRLMKHFECRSVLCSSNGAIGPVSQFSSAEACRTTGGKPDEPEQVSPVLSRHCFLCYKPLLISPGCPMTNTNSAGVLPDPASQKPSTEDVFEFGNYDDETDASWLSVVTGSTSSGATVTRTYAVGQERGGVGWDGGAPFDGGRDTITAVIRPNQPRSNGFGSTESPQGERNSGGNSTENSTVVLGGHVISSFSDWLIDMQLWIQRITVSCLIGVLGCGLLLLVATRSSEPIDVIHVYLCVALILFLVTALVMIEVRTMLACQAVAWMFHCTTLLVAGVFVIEALYVYVIVTGVASYVSVRQVCKCLALSTLIGLGFSTFCFIFLHSSYVSHHSCWINCADRLIVMLNLALPCLVMMIALLAVESAGMHSLARFPLTCKTSHDNGTYSTRTLPLVIVLALLLWISWPLCICYRAAEIYSVMSIVSIIFVVLAFMHIALCSFRVRLLLFLLYSKYLKRCCGHCLSRTAKDFAKKHSIAASSLNLDTIRQVRDDDDLAEVMEEQGAGTSKGILRVNKLSSIRSSTGEAEHISDIVRIMLSKTVPPEPARMWKKVAKQTVAAQQTKKRRAGPKHQYK